MLKEVIYWTYYFFEKKNRRKKDRWNWHDSMMFVSVSLFINVLSIMYIVEYYAHFRILKYIPITTRAELKSWIWAIIMLLPFMVPLYIKYYRPSKLSNLKLRYESMSKNRLMLGRIFYFCYCLATWIGFFVIAKYFEH